MNKNAFDMNNLQWLMCHKTTPNQTKQNFLRIFTLDINIYLGLLLIFTPLRVFNTIVS